MTGDFGRIYDPTSRTFRLTGTILGGRANCALTVLPSGLVLLTGGDINGVGTDGSDRTEVWYPQNIYNSHVISGTVTTGTGGMSGVFLTGLPGLPMTNGAGYYEGVVLDGWDGIVVPARPGYAFSPANQTYGDVSADIPAQNYTVISGPTIPSKLRLHPAADRYGRQYGDLSRGDRRDPGRSGTRVPTASNTVVLSLRNAGSAILGGTLSQAAVGGVATFEDLTVDTVGTGYLLRANSGSLTEVDSIPFDIIPTPTLTISGTIMLHGSPLSGVVLSGLTGSAVTDANGNYSAAVDYGWSGTVTPTLAGYSFDPISVPYSNVTSCLVGQNYAAALLTYVLSANAVNGEITLSPLLERYGFGSTVQLTAVPATAYHFTEWAGDASGSANPVMVTMDGDKTVTANFRPTPTR